MKLKPVRVLLCDDSPTFRACLANLIARSGNYDLVGTAKNGIEAVEKSRALSPDIIIMDIKMPEMDGIEAAIRIKSIRPEIIIIMFSSAEDDPTVFSALSAGADGYCLKKYAGQLPSMIEVIAQDSSAKTQRERWSASHLARAVCI